MTELNELEEMLNENEERISEIRDILAEEQEKEKERSEAQYDGAYMSRYRELMDQHRDVLEKHQEFVDVNTGLLKELSTNYDEAIHNFREETIQALKDYENFLEEISEDKQSKSVENIMAGGGLIFAGIASAAYYSARFMTNMVDFYAESPEIYVDEPEIAFFTLGLPIAGAYMLKKSYDLSRDSEKYRKEKRKISNELEEF